MFENFKTLLNKKSFRDDNCTFLDKQKWMEIVRVVLNKRYCQKARSIYSTNRSKGHTKIAKLRVGEPSAAERT